MIMLALLALFFQGCSLFGYTLVDEAEFKDVKLQYDNLQKVYNDLQAEYDAYKEDNNLSLIDCLSKAQDAYDNELRDLCKNSIYGENCVTSLNIPPQIRSEFETDQGNCYLMFGDE